MASNPKWVLPLICDIIDYADQHGHDELSHDLKAVAEKHFVGDKNSALRPAGSKIVRFRKSSG